MVETWVYSRMVVTSLLLASVGCQGGCNRGRPDVPGVDIVGPAGEEICLVRMNEQGKPQDAEALARLSKDLGEKKPTDVFLFSHGWNNSETEATESNQRLAKLVADVSKEVPESRPEGFLAYRIGLIWPSKALDEGSNLEGIAKPPLTEGDKNLIKENFPSEADQKIMHDLAEKNPAELTKQDWVKAKEIMRRNAIPPESLGSPATDEMSVFDKSAPAEEAFALEGRFGNSGIADAIRVFTFWQMKKRAGIVGENGGKDVLLAVQKAAPKARVHLIGHSFGCKVVLSTLLAAGKKNATPVRSAILLQPAISYEAFADVVESAGKPGGYKEALKMVDGPVVATFSSKDVPLTRFYPLGAAFVGAGGELESPLDRFRAMGGHGIHKLQAIAMKEVKESYGFANGSRSYSLASSKVITGHSDIQKPEVAWLIWSAASHK
jgi:hypothetical protein